MKKLLLTVLLIGCVQWNLAGTRPDENGRIKGVVVDQSNAAILSAKITISGKGRKWVLAPNAADGRFEVEVPAGTYEIKIQAYQFHTLKQKKIQIKPGVDNEQKFMLRVLPTKPQKCTREPCL